ncbi:hypothetical protein AGMMS50293_14600 [Spirochaetia bacterium]|nr:hypothetical protein AGMMS50293_14600 [Spirochaetia bacterium]
MQKRCIPFILILTAGFALCRCVVVPYLEDGISSLTVKPRQFFYLIDYNFLPADELTVTVVDATGHTHDVPVKSTRVDYDNSFNIAGEKRGTVSYRGKVADFVVVVYDPEKGPPSAEGPFIIIE